jgi:hypothetical protein
MCAWRLPPSVLLNIAYRTEIDGWYKLVTTHYFSWNFSTSEYLPKYSEQTYLNQRSVAGLKK